MFNTHKIVFANSFIRKLRGVYFRKNSIVIFKNIKSIHTIFLKKSCKFYTFSYELEPIRQTNLSPNLFIKINSDEKYIVEIRNN